MARINRRDFLRAAGAGTLLTAYPWLHTVAAPGPFSDYRALVCVFLFGGNDSWNMVVPRSQAEYDVYAASRQNLAIDRDALLPINPLSSDGVDYGLHPAMGGLQSLFESGRAAFVTNVGPLIEPTTRDQYQAGSVQSPPQLFSHNDQQDQWLSLKGRAQTKTGWAGRIADLVRTEVAGQQLPTNASLFGASLFQAGDDTVAYVMGPAGPISFEGFGDSGFGLAQREAFERIIGAEYESIYERAFAAVQQRAVSTADLVTSAIEGAPILSTAFPASQLGQQLETVARLIAVRERLGMERQIFFVASGGFDTHDDQNELQPELLGGVSDAMRAFYDATVELQVAENVTTFTQSDFGRTLTSNGDGTDHAWGGIQIVSGNAVAGGELYGSYPLLAIDGPEDVGGGRFIPSTSSDQFAATLAHWFGIPDADLGSVAPHIDNFVQRNLGFML